MLDLASIKKQLRLEDPEDTSDDEYLELLGEAAIDNLQQVLNRKLYATEQELEDDPEAPLTATVITASLKIAGLMLVSDLYENRGGTSTLTIKDNPAFKRLTDPYRVYPNGN